MLVMCISPFALGALRQDLLGIHLDSGRGLLRLADNDFHGLGRRQVSLLAALVDLDGQRVRAGDDAGEPELAECITFDVGPAEALPYADACFDAAFAEGIRFAAQCRVMTDGVISSGEQGSPHFSNARRVTIVAALATDYHGEDPADACERTIARAPREFAAIVAAHRALYDRVDFELDGCAGDLPIDKRIERIRAGREDHEPSLDGPAWGGQGDPG
jgi:hypothetical protein